MSAATGTDWTRILSDPELVRHVGKLLQTYREAPVEKREEALLSAMKEIKAGSPSASSAASFESLLRIQFRRQLQPHLLLNPISSVQTGAVTADGILGLSVLWP